MTSYDGKLTFNNLEVISTYTPTDEEREEDANRPNYWESTDIEDWSFEEVAALVEEYLEDMKSQGISPNISWAPLSPARWELVGFHPDYGTAIIDSVYATPEVARAIKAAYPDVDEMVFNT